MPVWAEPFKTCIETVANNDSGMFEINSKLASEVLQHSIGTRRELAGIFLVIDGIGANSRKYCDQHIAAKFKEDTESESRYTKPAKRQVFCPQGVLIPWRRQGRVLKDAS